MIANIGKLAFGTILALLILSGGLVYMYRTDIYNAVRDLDRAYAGERLKDIKGILTSDVDWTTLPASMRESYNYSWLDSYDRTGPLKIAHGLGGRGEDSNTLKALKASQKAGMTVFEVDIWPYKDDMLLCHHGPAEPVTPLPENVCTLPVLMDRLGPEDYVVLDIKKDVLPTARRIFEQIKDPADRRKLIFQLYAPDHVREFRKWHKDYDLPGPIVTTYRSKRSLNHIYAALSGKTNMRIMTVPIDRLSALRQHDSNIRVFTHPVSTCADKGYALSQSVSGLYLKNILTCPDK